MRIEARAAWQAWIARRAFMFGHATVVATVLGAVIVGALWVRGESSLALRLGLALGVVVAGLGTTFVLARRWFSAAVEELRARVGDRDRGPSPVPWISTETWRREQPWDAAYEVLYGREGEGRPAVDEPTVCVATDADRRDAPRVEPTMDPPPFDDEPASVLSAAPLAVRLWVHGPAWPLCCERLATLVGFARGVDLAVREALPSAHFLRAEIAKEWGVSTPEAVEAEAARPYGRHELAQGHAVYHCRVCGCVYLGSYHP